MEHRSVKELSRRLCFLLHRAELERDLDEEMRHHLALSAQDRGGAEAAQRQFGNVTLLKEESRAMWTWTFWEQLAQDIRYGLRTMAANPLFTAMAVLSLALGIGANTAIYSFMDAILLRSLPVQYPEQLVVINWRAKNSPAVIHGQNGTRHRDDAGMASPNYPFAAFQLLRSNQDALSILFAHATAYELNLVADDQAEIADAQLVSGGFYLGLGVFPAAGRLIVNDDDHSGAPPVAVISYQYWQRRFAAAIGRRILINNTPFTIVGVSAPGFFGVNPELNPKVYLPLHAVSLLAANPSEEEKKRFFDSNYYWLEMMGRLRPGVSAGQAQAALAGQFHQFVDSTASTAKEKADLPALWLQAGAGGLDSLRRRYSKPLYVLMAMVGLILTIACANIANLLLARSTARRREMAVRLSLGAGRMRVVRQLLTESALLSLAGGLLGVLVALWGIRSITWLLANGRDNFTLHATLNWPVLGFTLALALATGLIFGLAPAIQATKVDLTPALKETRAGAQRGPARRIGLGVSLSQALVALQIAISLLLVVAASLFGRTLSNLQSVDLGFNKENVLLFGLNARQAGYKNAALAQFYADLLSDFRRLPGVRSAGLSQFPLAIGSVNTTYVSIPGAPTTVGPKPETCYIPVDPSFLETMQIPILLGRGFEQRDMLSPKVAVVTEQFAKKFFAGQNPVGLRIGFGGQKKPADIEIIGVAKTTLYNSVKETETPPVTYVPFTQDLPGLSRVHFELRTAGDPLALVSAVRRTVHKASASVPVSDISTQAARIDQTISQERTFAWLCACFAALALAIACVGLYGTMAYAVARRTNEIGIRMALGAERRRIIWMVLREVFALGAAGLAIGLAVAWATAKFVESFLFGVKRNHPGSLAISVFVLLAVVFLAGYAPAWKASRIDPMAALRHE
jgi:macrolide transport system ATP-binding/permease protein